MYNGCVHAHARVGDNSDQLHDGLLCQAPYHGNLKAEASPNRDFSTSLADLQNVDCDWCDRRAFAAECVQWC
jgi:hypothetical protein